MFLRRKLKFLLTFLLLTISLIFTNVKTSYAAEEEEFEFYTVKRGDYLSKLAIQFYDDMERWPEMYKLNTEIIYNPDLIYPGQVFRISKDSLIRSQ